MGSVSRTPTCCQEENMRTRGRDEKKEREGRGITTASRKSVFYMEHLIYHILPEMQSKYMSVTVAESETSTCEILPSMASIISAF